MRLQASLRKRVVVYGQHAKWIVFALPFTIVVSLTLDMLALHSHGLETTLLKVVFISSWTEPWPTWPGRHSSPMPLSIMFQCHLQTTPCSPSEYNPPDLDNHDLDLSSILKPCGFKIHSVPISSKKHGMKVFTSRMVIQSPTVMLAVVIDLLLRTNVILVT